ncbi:MAG: hypothetical protein HY225_01380 [Candidatus Vogelbacteria bacterium]|nr:hypothetical protein [Candidatus Vogelbacteria bacterium]
MSSKEKEKYEWQTPKEDFLPLTNLARKAGNLYGGDQAEVNMWPENNTLPQINITETIILIPLSKKEALKRLFETKRKKMEVYGDKIKETYGVDVDNISFEDIEKRYAGKIYWYPQRNISLAVKYLTTHPKKIKEFCAEANG